MKLHLKEKLTAFKRFLIQWNEFVSIPLAIVLFWIGGSLIRWLDPTAGLFDAGIFQIIIFAVAAFLFLHGIAWIVLKITFPKAYFFLDEIFEIEIERFENEPIPQEWKLSTYQKCVLVLLYFFGCLFAMVLLARVIM
ncbi:MAG TPA: hypothetical protein VMW42_06815 [Desulfatiglandales bacterium]|nr:hypothetical protein [Desulfatiglandales bacterium]